MSHVEIIGARSDRWRIGLNLNQREAEALATALRYAADGEVMETKPARRKAWRRIADQLSVAGVHHDPDLRLA